MNGKISIGDIFAGGAEAVSNDMNRIVGRPVTTGSLESCGAGCWIAHPFDKAKRDACFNSCAVKYNVPSPIPPPVTPGRHATQAELEFKVPDWAKKPEPQHQPQPQAGNMLDFSSPLNTIVKSLFFLSLSPMFSGTYNFYIISVGCAGAIIYSLLKFNRS